MNLFGFLARRGRSEVKAAPRASVQPSDGGVVIRTPADLEDLLRIGGETSSGTHVTPNSAMRVAAVFACVRLVSSAVGTMPLDIKRRVDDRTRADATDHPLWQLLRRRPNRWMKPKQFRQMLTAHLLLRGNAYCLIVRGGDGRVAELWPLHPDRVLAEQLADMTLSYTYTRKDGRTEKLSQGEVFHLTGLTLDGVTGVSVITYARESVGLALATEKHGTRLFRNGASVGGILKHPKALGNEARENLKASLEQFQGADQAGKTMVLEEGLDYAPVGMTSEDAQYIETRKFTRGEIAMFFGVPPHMIGDTDKATSWGSGIEQQSLGFVAYTLEDWLTTWEEAIGVDLMSEADQASGHYARFNRAALVRGDIKARFEAYAMGRRMKVFSANDVRSLEDLNPVPGGDVYENPDITVPKG